MCCSVHLPVPTIQPKNFFQHECTAIFGDHFCPRMVDGVPTCYNHLDSVQSRYHLVFANYNSYIKLAIRSAPLHLRSLVSRLVDLPNVVKCSPIPHTSCSCTKPPVGPVKSEKYCVPDQSERLFTPGYTFDVTTSQNKNPKGRSLP